MMDAASHAPHATTAASPWIVRFASLLRPGGHVIDIACGHGRHARFFAARGAQVLAVDRDGAVLHTLSGIPGITIRQLDLEAEASEPALHTATGVQAIQDMKTGALIRFSACAGAILASAPAAEIQALAAYGDAIGAAFQIADDLLDVGGTAAQVGKGTGKDAKAGKATWISLLGVDGARTRLAQLEREAAQAVTVFGARGDALAQAATFVARRQK